MLLEYRSYLQTKTFNYCTLKIKFKHMMFHSILHIPEYLLWTWTNNGKSSPQESKNVKFNQTHEEVGKEWLIVQETFQALLIPLEISP